MNHKEIYQKIGRKCSNLKYKKTALKEAVKLTLQERNAEVKQAIADNREEMGYVLCYGLEQDLTKKQIDQFEKIFITLYEEKLLEKLGLEDIE